MLKCEPNPSIRCIACLEKQHQYPLVINQNVVLIQLKTIKPDSEDMIEQSPALAPQTDGLWPLIWSKQDTWCKYVIVTCHVTLQHEQMVHFVLPENLNSHHAILHCAESKQCNRMADAQVDSYPVLKAS